MEEAFNQLKKEFDSLRDSFTECRTELALSKCKSDDKIAELQRQVAALVESNIDLLRRVNALSPQTVVPPWEKVNVELGSQSQSLKCESQENKKDPVEATVKHKSTEKKQKAKDWDAICRELSDDEEKEAVEKDPVPEKAPTPPAPLSVLERIQQSRPNVPVENWDMIECFMSVFRAYMQALQARNLQLIHANILEIGPIAISGLMSGLLEWHSESPEFVPLAQAVLKEMTTMCREMELICWECPCRMFTPVNMMDHLIDDEHFDEMKKLGMTAYIHAMAVQRVLGKLSHLLKRSNLLQRGEVALHNKGRTLYQKLVNDSRLRPTEEFVRTKTREFLELACANDPRATALVNIPGHLDPADDEYRMRVIRNRLRVESNRIQFLKELDEHLSTGVASCSMCEVAFVSMADYYKHVTSYFHARTDHQCFTGCIIRIARGDQDWKIDM